MGRNTHDRQRRRSTTHGSVPRQDHEDFILSLCWQRSFGRCNLCLPSRRKQLKLEQPGKVPQSLWNLPCLRVVALHGNSFTGEWVFVFDAQTALWRVPPSQHYEGDVRLVHARVRIVAGICFCRTSKLIGLLLLHERVVGAFSLSVARSLAACCRFHVLGTDLEIIPTYFSIRILPAPGSMQALFAEPFWHDTGTSTIARWQAPPHAFRWHHCFFHFQGQKNPRVQPATGYTNSMHLSHPTYLTNLHRATPQRAGNIQLLPQRPSGRHGALDPHVVFFPDNFRQGAVRDSRYVCGMLAVCLRRGVLGNKQQRAPLVGEYGSLFVYGPAQVARPAHGLGHH